MSRPPTNTLRALGVGTAVAVLSALLCLACAASRDSRTLSLHEFAQLTHGESVLMSCAEGAHLSSRESRDDVGGDPLWCSDPSSPHCRPAAPPAARLELSDSPLWTVTPVLEARTELPVVLRESRVYPRPEAATLHSLRSAHRLERPPRA
jgi:hypothetical protein